MISPAQLKLIHIAKRQLERQSEGHFDDAQYRMVLRSIGGVDSSKDLDNRSFERVMAHLESMGFKGSVPDCSSPKDAQHNRGLTPSSYWARKSAQAATPRAPLTDRQRHLITDLASQISDLKLPGFIRRMTASRTDQIDSLTAKEAWNITEALKSMTTRKAKATQPHSKGGPSCPAGPVGNTQTPADNSVQHDAGKPATVRPGPGRGFSSDQPQHRPITNDEVPF